MWEWREAGTDVVDRDREVDVVAAFVVSLLFVHIHPYAHTQGFVTPFCCWSHRQKQHTLSGLGILSTELSSSIACVCAGQHSCSFLL